MSQTFQAIVENGVLKPLTRVRMPEGAEVTVTISGGGAAFSETAVSAGGSDDQPEWLGAHGPMSDEDTAIVREAIGEAFERVDPDAWR